MNKAKADLITHPLRIRILGALMGRDLTAGQIAALLPDIPVPSLYRHLKTLLDGGAVRVAEEVRVNGALTKVYATVPEMTYISPQDVQNAGKAEHLQHFTTFLNTLGHTFQAALEQNDSQEQNALISASVSPLYLSAEETEEFQRQLGDFLRPWHERAPNAERRRLLLSLILFPDSTEPPRE